MNPDDLPRWAKVVLVPVTFLMAMLLVLIFVGINADNCCSTLTADETDFVEGVSESIEGWFPWMLAGGAATFAGLQVWRFFKAEKARREGQNEKP